MAAKSFKSAAELGSIIAPVDEFYPKDPNMDL